MASRPTQIVVDEVVGIARDTEAVLRKEKAVVVGAVAYEHLVEPVIGVKGDDLKAFLLLIVAEVYLRRETAF